MEGTFDLIRADPDGALSDVVPINDLSEADLLEAKAPIVWSWMETG